MIGISQLNKVSRNRSLLGRKPRLSNTVSFRPRHKPPMMRILWAGFTMLYAKTKSNESA
jgi:hypothetical protein